MTCSIIQKSQLEGAMRLDAEYYCNGSLIKSNFCFGKDVVSFIQYGTSKELNEESQGYPVLRLNEFEEYFAGQPTKYCNKIRKSIFQGLQLKKNDVLICRTNGNPRLVGKAALVGEDTNFAFASYLFRVQTDTSKINSSTLVAFLNSKFGRAEIEKFLMPSIQSNFSPAQFRQIKIPIFPDILQNKIEKYLFESYKFLGDSKKLYSKAEGLLLRELGLENFDAEESLSSIVNFSDILVARRMDAEYFQGEFEKIIKIIKKKTKVFSLKNITDIKRGSLINPDFYDSNGTPYLRGKDFSSGKIIKNNLVFINKKFEQKNETRVEAGDIVFSSIGSVGTLALVSKRFNDSFISNNTGKISILDKNKLIPEYLTLILHSIVGQSQFDKYATRTAQPKISDEQIRSFTIPILPRETQEKIADLVQKSHEARKKARELLEEAKRKVEEMIENQN